MWSLLAAGWRRTSGTEASGRRRLVERPTVPVPNGWETWGVASSMALHAQGGVKERTRSGDIECAWARQESEASTLTRTVSAHYGCIPALSSLFFPFLTSCERYRVRRTPGTNAAACTCCPGGGGRERPFENFHAAIAKHRGADEINTSINDTNMFHMYIKILQA